MRFGWHAGAGFALLWALSAFSGLSALTVGVGCQGRWPLGGSSNAPESEGGTPSETAATEPASPLRGDDLPEGGPGTTLPDQVPEGALMFALSSPTPVLSAPEWPPKDPTRATPERAGVQRLGYLRKGQSVRVKPDILKRPNCQEGWFELVSGGFVCGKYATADANHKDLAQAPHPPLEDGPLPYAYGLNLVNGAPLYRRPPLRRERRDLEKGLAVGKTPPPSGANRTASRTVTAMASPPAAPLSASTDVPWYLRDHKGVRPSVSFDELKGETGLVFQRMVRGFYLALDREVATYGGRFWRTNKGFYVPREHLLVHKPVTEFEGVKIGSPGESRKLPLAWVLGLHARRYRFDGDKIHRGDKLERFTILPLTGNKKTFESRVYYETDDGTWTRDLDGTLTKPGPVPADLGPNEKWIDINRTTQTLVAFEGTQPVYATLVSTGRHDNEDKTKDHATIVGDFRIREKHISATMDDDGGSDGPYSIEDVPWIMYFHGSFALHGAFWHSSFGHERSHGCVNMTPHDAKELFQWAGPNLPEHWHGIRASDKNPGTRVIVHD